MLADLLILLQVYNPVPTQRSEATLAGITAFLDAGLPVELLDHFRDRFLARADAHLLPRLDI